MFPIREWLIAWITGATLFLSIPFAAILFNHVRSVRAAGVADPLRIVLMELSAFLGPRRDVRLGDFVGDVFCTMNVRWGPHGEGVAVARPDAVGTIEVVFRPGPLSGRVLTFIPSFRRGRVAHGQVLLADGVEGVGTIIRLAT
jgi:hypothetical protein